MAKERMSIVGSRNDDIDDDVVEGSELLEYHRVKAEEHVSLAKILFKNFNTFLETALEIEHMRQQRKLLEAEINHKRTLKKGQDRVDALKSKVKKGKIGFDKNKK